VKNKTDLVIKEQQTPDLNKKVSTNIKPRSKIENSIKNSKNSNCGGGVETVWGRGGKWLRGVGTWCVPGEKGISDLKNPIFKPSQIWLVRERSWNNCCFVRILDKFRENSR
jgi:hypothetical protein